MSASYRLQGIVIKRTNVGEADKIVTLYTPDRGKVALMAKGVRKLSSKRGGSIELFILINCRVQSAKGLDILTELEVTKSYSAWKKHLGRINVAYQLIEVVDKLTPDEEPHPKVYELLNKGLSQIQDLGDDWQEVITGWFLEIMSDLGFWDQDKKFNGDIYSLIEDISEREFKSPKMLRKLN